MKIIKENLSFIKILNTFLRIFGMGSKFVVFTLMSKYLDNNIFGDYSLITSLITVLIFILGFDFYFFSIRDIVSTNNISSIKSKVASSFLFYFIVYIFFIIISLLFFDKITYLKPYLFLFLGITITEHLSQEIYRLLIGFKKILFANLLMFFRVVGWAVIVISLIYTTMKISLEEIFLYWFLTNSISIIFVLIYLLIKDGKTFSHITINWTWIVLGLKISLFFFLATISLKVVEYANRFIIGYYINKEMAGVFTFYSNIAILITLYINTVVVSFDLPDLIKNSNNEKIKPLLKKFKKSLLFHILLVAIAIIVFIKPILFWQNKILFEKYYPLIFFMVISVSLMNYSLYFHFKLYIIHKDRSIFKVMTISGVFSLIVTIIFTYFFGIYGSAFSFLLSGIIMYVLRKHEADKFLI